jgi:FkbM family methyltransferase
MRKLTSWLLKETKGVTLLDKIILLFLKIIYLALRVSIRIVLGKKRTDRLYIKRNIGFNSFLYKSLKLFGVGNSMLLKISVPKYNYKFYCRINNEDYTFMTGHEDEIEEHFTPKGGDTIVDVGAHLGHYTLISSKRVGANGKVIAIEADQGNFEMLNRNIKLNGLTNVIPLNYAVYSKQTKLKLYLPDEESGFTIYNTIMVNRTKPEEKFVEVNANTLDNLLLLQQQQSGINHADINWIKIDVEGAEFEVLKGATNILSKSKDIALLIEVHGQDNYRPVVEFLNVYNFKIEFEKSNENGDWRHIIARKSCLL